MRFRSISIRNYRQYRSLDLEFRPGTHDLQVIVADNGVGKTNLLNAFTWCLYGEEPHLGNSGRYEQKQRIEPKLNKEVIAECVASGKSKELVSVSIDIEYERDNKARVLRVKRSVPFLIKQTGEFSERSYDTAFTVSFIGGNRMPLAGDDARICIDKILPQSIREYFFFDGEQLNSYFKANGGDRIKEAVYSISQIDLFRTIISRLDKVLTAKRREASSTSTDTSDLEKKLSQEEQLAEGCKKFIQEKEANIEELDQRLAEIDDQLRGVDDVAALEAKRSELQRKCDAASERLENKRAEFYAFVRTRAIDFYLFPAAKGALDSIRELQNEGQLPPSIDSARLEESLATGQCVVCRHHLDEQERAYIRELLDQFKVGSETSNILSSMTSELSRTIGSVKSYPFDRKRMIEDLDAAENDLDYAERNLKEIEKSIAKYADTGDGIKKLYEDRKQFMAEKAKCHEEIGTRRSNLAKAENSIRKFKLFLDRALRNNTQAAELKSIIDFGNKAQKVLRDAEASVIKETKDSMERRTENLFRGLVWKESKCDHIELSENYTPALYDKAGFSCAGTCSAAERSLLALSFTLAMHEVSGFDSPLFIDTPIARASGENRENFAKTLVEVSEKKQLILAFTPDEYTESISNEFDPAISTFIRLRLDESESHVVEPEVFHYGR